MGSSLRMDFDEFYLNLCFQYALRSKDPIAKVGAVLVNAEKKLPLGFGYNGFPRGVIDREEWWNNKELKNTFVIHAELNAVLNAVRDLEGSTCYCTRRPCPACTAILIQAGVKEFVYPLGSKGEPMDYLSEQQCLDAGVTRREVAFEVK